MKVLLVEDNATKLREVYRVIEEAGDRKDLHIDTADSFITALRMLEENVYGLLILDLVIPIRKGELPDDRGGVRILEEILSDGKCNKPAHVVCLTAYKEPAAAAGKTLSIAHVVIYDETIASWMSILKQTVKYVIKRGESESVRENEHLCDLLVITSSPHVELNAVLSLPSKLAPEYNRKDELHYYIGNWQRSTTTVMDVVACAAPTMGMTAACATAFKAISTWRPRFIAMCGIAAGTSKDCTYGDILVAQSAFDYGSGKIVEGEHGARSFIPSPQQLDIDAGLHSLLQQWEREQKRMDAIIESWTGERHAKPRLKTGVFASGAAVVQSAGLVHEILSGSRKVVGLEMEAYGVFQAAYLSQIPKPRVLIAKSISDFADQGKSDDWQKFAAFTSARFVYEFFTQATEIPLGRDVL